MTQNDLLFTEVHFLHLRSLAEISLRIPWASWSSKVMQEVVRQLLDAYFEPTFSDRSHGFRPGRGCHTALSEIVHEWKGVHWITKSS